MNLPVKLFCLGSFSKLKHLCLHKQSVSLVYFLLTDLCSPELLRWYHPGNCLPLFHDSWGHAFLEYSSHHRVSCDNHPHLLFYGFIFIHIWLIWGFIVIKWFITIKRTFRLHLPLFIWDFFEFDDNIFSVRYSMSESFAFISEDEILSFKTLTINPDESFVISLEGSFPAIILSSSKQSLLSTSAWIFLKLLISFNILSWFTFLSSCVDCSKLVSSNIIFSVNCFLSCLKYPAY